jgi:hypothetical protein
MSKKDDKKITVEAQLVVLWADGTRFKVIRRFEKAWEFANSLPADARPIRINFDSFVRIEDED